MEEEVPRASTPDMNSGGNQPHTSLEPVAPAAVVVVDGASQDPEILARGARASADDAEEQSPRGDVVAPSDGLDVQQDQNDPGVGDAADPLIHTSAPSTGPASARIRLDASLSESAIGSDVSTVVAPKPGAGQPDLPDADPDPLASAAGDVQGESEDSRGDKIPTLLSIMSVTSLHPVAAAARYFTGPGPYSHTLPVLFSLRTAEEMLLTVRSHSGLSHALFGLLRGVDESYRFQRHNYQSSRDQVELLFDVIRSGHSQLMGQSAYLSDAVDLVKDRLDRFATEWSASSARLEHHMGSDTF